ncbi:hypothetical protein E8E11_009716 [Didymella keratinophila]|nr:hypothetical protein E8E11_009716 [Didymella keratinophila]
MSALSPASSNNVKYYSAYRRPVFDANGKFHHFARQCDPLHERNGYWQFSTYLDDQRAHMLGFHNPEDVLKAQDAGDGEYDDIFLLWVPGKLDTSNKTSIGTAAVHLQTIYNERKLLGKTLAFRGAVPLYPFSLDPRLLQYRLARYGIQKGKLPKNLHSPTSPPPDMRSMQLMSPTPPPSTTIAPIDSPSRAIGRKPQAKPNFAPKALSLSKQSKTVQRSPSTSALAAPSLDQTPVRSSAPIAATHALHTKASSKSIECLQRSFPVQHHDRIDSPLDPPDISTEFESTLAKDIVEHLQTYQSEETILLDDDEGCHLNDIDMVITEDAVDTVDILSLATSTPGDMFYVQAASLPCMDCGLIGFHISDCWINEVAMNLKGPEDLTISELDALVDKVTEFDPMPWTTRHGPLEPVEEDLETLRSMAEVIRSLDETAKDLDLQGLNDQSTVLLWALSSVGEVEILREHQEESDIEMLDV